MSTVELAISGMTCASCANRIERKLNKLPGVSASVNYATERASVDVAGDVSPHYLISTVETAGYGATVPTLDASTEADPADALRRRLAISLVLSVPVVAMAMVPALQFEYWQWVSLALASPVVAWGAWPFHRAAWTNLRHGAATMDTLISMGTLAAYAWSLYALFFGTAGRPGMTHAFSFTVERGHGAATIYLEAAAAVTTLILAGRFFEARAKRRAGAALKALLDSGARDVAVVRDGREVSIPIGELAVGERFVVRPGQTIATDGTVVDGASAVDASMFTGESVPVEVGLDDPVVGGTLNVGGRLLVRADRVGSDTQLAQLVRLIEQAQNGKAPVQRLADRVSGVFVPIVIAVALATAGTWMIFGGGVTAAFSAAVAVLIIACPCALGLATPTALMVGTGRGAQLGIVIKGPEVLEQTRTVDTVVLDKTGTVTTGRMSLGDVIPAAGEDRADLLRLAGALEDASEHPVARAISEAARDVSDVDLPVPTEFANVAGLGVRGTVAGHVAVIGRPRLVGHDLPPLLADAVTAAEARGRTAVVMAWDGRVRGVLVVGDQVKDTSAEAVARLRTLGLRPLLLTGDNATAAAAVARQVGIADDDVIAEVLPADKVAVITRLQREGRVVAMVGDGINDAAALARADLGIALGTGADVAIEASDLTLVRGDLRLAADAIRLARHTLRTIRGNLMWAFGYNVAAVPLAAAGLLNPMIAGAAMAFSSVFVVGNSLRLRRFA